MHDVFTKDQETVETEMKANGNNYNRQDNKTSTENMYFFMLFSCTIKPHEVMKWVLILIG